MEESPQFAIPDGGEFVDESGRTVRSARFVTFRFEAMENPAASAREGRQVFDKALIVRTYYPGSRDTLDRVVLRWPNGSEERVVDDPALWEIVRDVAERWMEKQDAALSGTPLALMNLDVAAIATLRASGIGSVEMLAQAPETAARAIPGFFDLRRRAREFLEAQQRGAPAAKAEAEARAAREEAEELRRQLEELKRELAAREAPADAEPPMVRRMKHAQTA